MTMCVWLWNKPCINFPTAVLKTSVHDEIYTDQNKVSKNVFNFRIQELKLKSKSILIFYIFSAYYKMIFLFTNRNKWVRTYLDKCIVRKVCIKKSSNIELIKFIKVNFRPITTSNTVNYYNIWINLKTQILIIKDTKQSYLPWSIPWKFL